MDDFRSAWRQIRNAPSFAAVVISLIAIGIAANATIFTLVDTLLLKPLPVRAPGELVRIVTHHPPIPDGSYFDYSYWKFLRAHSTSFSAVIAQADFTSNMTAGGGISYFIDAGMVSENYFATLGVKPFIGTWMNADDQAVLSYSYWQKRFHGDRGVIGRVIKLNTHPFTITGITPPDFHGTTVELNPDVRIPAKAATTLVDVPGMTEEGYFQYELVARLKPGVSLERARDESISLHESWEQEFAKRRPDATPEDLKLAGELQVQGIERGVSVLRDQFASALQLLMAGVALVLLMVCSNVAGLLLERATARERETAVRLAIGATQGRLIRQWLTESLALALLGGALGIVLAWLAMPLLGSMIPPLRNRGGELLMLDPSFGLNWRVLLFSFAACVLAAVIAGFAPAWRAGRQDLGQSLRTARSSSHVEGGITIFQIALCTLLLIQAGLFLRTLQSMRAMNIGVDRNHVVAFTLRPSHAVGYKVRLAFPQAAILNEARELPGVRSAAFAQIGLLRGTGIKTTAGLPGTRPTRADFMNTSLNSITPDYFETLGIRVIAGRNLTVHDVAGPSQGIVVNEALARRFFPGQDPIGKAIGTGGGVIKAERAIVGVVSDSQYRSLREPVPPTIYGLADDESGMILHLRAAGDPAALIGPVRELLRKAAPGFSILEINLLRDEAERSIWRERLVAQLTLGFAAVAVVLAMIGLYGTLAYYVSRNKRGIGIRVAIGAARSDVVALLASRVARLIAAGAVLGLAASFALSSTVQALLFGVPASDPVSMGLAMSLILGIAGVALVLPAWRAVRIDPAITLREE